MFHLCIFDLMKPNGKEMLCRCYKNEVICTGGENTVHDACSNDTWITVGNVTLNESDRYSFGC